jgi:hypothetical protein
MLLNFFASSLMMRPDKLERLSLETLSSQSKNLRARAEPTQLEHLSDTSLLGKLLELPENVRLDCKVIASYKHSSLFGLIISGKGKTFYNIDTSCQCYKSFLFITDLSQGVCPWQAFPA